MDVGGGIRLSLTVADGRVTGVDLCNDRPLLATAIFVGRDASDLPELVGRLFSLCGKAQTIAALTAVEQAQGIARDAAVGAARDALRIAEMTTQTAMRLALFWPRALGLAPQADLVRLCVEVETHLIAELLGGPGWTRPGAGTNGSSRALQPLLERQSAAVDRFVRASDLRDRVADLGLRDFGVLPPGIVPEHGALRRTWDDPGVAATRRLHGAALAARLAAALADLQRLTETLRLSLAAAAPAPSRPAARQTGTGSATVETARGPLVHDIEIADGTVVAFRTDAPTEANFRRGGPVDLPLVGANAKGLELAARLHVLAIDPCVDVAVEVHHA